MSYLDGIDESAKYAEKFWAESRRKRELREAHEARLARCGSQLERLNEMLRYVWGEGGMAFDKQLMRLGPQDLDEWLAEENPHRFTHFRVPGVLEALGIA